MKNNKNFNMTYQKGTSILLGTILLIFSSYQFATYIEKINAVSHRGLVILKIENLESGDSFAAIKEVISKDIDLNLEYGCSESGIVVIKFFNSRFNGKADNSFMIKRRIINATLNGNMDVIFIDVQPQSYALKG